MVGHSLWPRRLAAVVGVLELLQVGWFLSLNWKQDWQAALVGTSLALALMGAWRTTQGPTVGALCWDGQQWQWQDASHGAYTLRCHLDFQSVMLVSLRRSAGPTVWLWLQRSHNAHQWLALRRAVVHSTSPGRGRSALRGAPAHPVANP